MKRSIVAIIFAVCMLAAFCCACGAAEDNAEGRAGHQCEISISCATLLDNMDMLRPEKHGLVPEDGWILERQTAVFYEGESVFSVLERVAKEQKIHMEFSEVPLYRSIYIEGINNLYEFDAGELSGWMYKVNGEFANFGCSRYILKPDDVIEWVYTCDLGEDVGGGYAMESADET